MNSTRTKVEHAASNFMEAATMLTSLASALKELEAAENHPDVLSVPDHRVASLLQCYLAERANEEGKLELQRSGLEEAKFDDKDYLGWIGSFFTWWKGIKKHDWIEAAVTPEPIGNHLRAALLGDWGTGLYGAPISAKSIEDDPRGYGLLMHLGDVYYAGNKGEVRVRFIDIWPKNTNAISRAINSNHEMYTGGYGYFGLTLPRFQQKASHFALQNDHWTLVGLDSAYRDPHNARLTDDQIAWLRAIVEQAGSRKIVLFSHHQAFAWLETAKEKLVEQLAEFLMGKKIFAWYWGHEHRCVIYNQHPGWGLYGRCVGHSGYPYFRDKLDGFPKEPDFPKATWRKLQAKNLVPGGLVLNGPNPYVEDHPDEYGTQGHMTLEFDDGRLNEIVHLPDGTRVYERQLV
jgi:hypothetical protein